MSEDHVERPALVPEMYVSNLVSSLSFYMDLLGFRIEYERPEERFAYLSLGSAHLMLEEVPALTRATSEELRRGQWRTADLERPFGRGINLEVRVENVATIETRLQAAGREPLLSAHERHYRIRGEICIVRQMLVADPDGYLIRLSQLLTKPDPWEHSSS